ncbi:MAG: alpha/beta hydrolase [Myxococcales bacterium]|nr:alpha/beta hydrolase [Myxococcales bacterium]
MRFEALPEEPRVPHGFFELPEEKVVVPSSAFGRVSLSVRRAGSGPPLLLVHGLMTSSYSFRYAIAPLAEDYEVFVFDLPGAGRSDAPDVPYRADALADLIGETMDALSITGARVIGNSMGGYLAMRLALRRPEAMSRLVNLHSPGVPTPRMWALQAAMALPGAGAVLDRLVRRDPLRWAFRNVHYYDESLKSLEEAREYGAPLATPEGRRAFHRYLADTLRASDMRDFAATLEATPCFPVPLQLIYVRRDPMVPPEVGRALAPRVPDAEVVWLDEGSHFAHVDALDAFLGAARPFLAGR